MKKITKAQERSIARSR